MSTPWGRAASWLDRLRQPMTGWPGRVQSWSPGGVPVGQVATGAARTGLAGLGRVFQGLQQPAYWAERGLGFAGLGAAALTERAIPGQAGPGGVYGTASPALEKATPGQIWEASRLTWSWFRNPDRARRILESIEAGEEPEQVLAREQAPSRELIGQMLVDPLWLVGGGITKAGKAKVAAEAAEVRPAIGLAEKALGVPKYEGTWGAVRKFFDITPQTRMAQLAESTKAAIGTHLAQTDDPMKVQSLVRDAAQGLLRGTPGAGTVPEQKLYYVLQDWEAAAEGRVASQHLPSMTRLKEGGFGPTMTDAQKVLWGQKEAAAQVAGKAIPKVQKPYSSMAELSAAVLEDLDNIATDVGKARFGVVPPSAAERFQQGMKQIMSYAFLGFNPQTAWRNAYSNTVQAITWGVNPFAPKAWTQEADLARGLQRMFGEVPEHLHASFGVAQEAKGGPLKKFAFASRFNEFFERKFGMTIGWQTIQNVRKDNWKLGAALPQMPPELVASLERLQPGLSRKVYRNIENAFSTPEAKAALERTFGIQKRGWSMADALDDAQMVWAREHNQAEVLEQADDVLGKAGTKGEASKGLRKLLDQVESRATEARNVAKEAVEQVPKVEIREGETVGEAIKSIPDALDELRGIDDPAIGRTGWQLLQKKATAVAQEITRQHRPRVGPGFDTEASVVWQRAKQASESYYTLTQPYWDAIDRAPFEARDALRAQFHKEIRPKIWQQSAEEWLEAWRPFWEKYPPLDPLAPIGRVSPAAPAPTGAALNERLTELSRKAFSGKITPAEEQELRALANARNVATEAAENAPAAARIGEEIPPEALEAEQAAAQGAKAQLRGQLGPLEERLTIVEQAIGAQSEVRKFPQQLITTVWDPRGMRIREKAWDLNTAPHYKGIPLDKVMQEFGYDDYQKFLQDIEAQVGANRSYTELLRERGALRGQIRVLERKIAFEPIQPAGEIVAYRTGDTIEHTTRGRGKILEVLPPTKEGGAERVRVQFEDGKKAVYQANEKRTWRVVREAAEEAPQAVPEVSTLRPAAAAQTVQVGERITATGTGRGGGRAGTVVEILPEGAPEAGNIWKPIRVKWDDGTTGITGGGAYIRHATSVSAEDVIKGLSEGPGAASFLPTAEGELAPARRLLQALLDNVDRLPETRVPVPGEMADEVFRWLDQAVRPAMVDTHNAALAVAKQMRDWAVLYYPYRRGFDYWLQWLFPYQFWYTRTGYNQVMRMIDKPALAVAYYRLAKMMDEVNNSPDFPQRMRGRLRIRAPFLPKWMGDELFFDPMRSFIPFAQFTDPYLPEQAEGQSGLARAYQAMSSVVSPWPIYTWAGAASGVLKPKEEFVSGPQFPAARAISGIQRLRGAGVGGPLLHPIRTLLGLPPGETWDAYRTERMLSNMAADGDISPFDAKMAMLLKTGAAYEEAVRRANQERGITMVGGGLAGISGLSVYPTGEREQRGLQLQYTQEKDAVDPRLVDATYEQEKQLRAEDKVLDEKLAKFYGDWYEAHPEYEVRQSIWKDDRDLAVDLIWDMYFKAKSGADAKKAVGEEFSKRFQKFFLSRDSRDYTQFTDAELKVLVQRLAGITAELEPSAQAGAATAAPKLPADGVAGPQPSPSRAPSKKMPANYYPENYYRPALRASYRQFAGGGGGGGQPSGLEWPRYLQGVADAELRGLIDSYFAQALAYREQYASMHSKLAEWLKGQSKEEIERLGNLWFSWRLSQRKGQPKASYSRGRTLRYYGGYQGR